MGKLVTIGIPIYKRLEYLPNALRIVAAQDYPDIDLLVSDNGLNGTAVQDIVAQHYFKPYRFRQNAATVSGSRHWTELIENAHGEYFVLLADDDEISPNFVSELVQTLERHPEASAALGMEEVIDQHGRVVRKSNPIPEVLPGEAFIRASFGTREYGYESLCTFLAKTEKLLSCGGFPDLWAATSDEDMLMIKLSLDSHIAFNTNCAFRKRFYEASGGYAIGLPDLARGIREYLACLDSDPQVLRYAALHSSQWKELRDYLVESAWSTYYVRWETMYRKRMSHLRWIAAGFALPFPKYFGVFVSILIRGTMSALLAQVQRFFPSVYTMYKAVKSRLVRSEQPKIEAPL
jgi:glycosyltransferase involved in cell wall biosynthesis